MNTGFMERCYRSRKWRQARMRYSNARPGTMPHRIPPFFHKLRDLRQRSLKQ